MFCHHCHAEIEDGYQFCPKCGLRLKSVNGFLNGPQGRRRIRWSVAAAMTLLVAGLIGFGVRQNQISKLKQGKRDGLAYIAWLAGVAPSASRLELAIGKPIRSIQVANSRSITWYRIRDGFLGMESANAIFHFRPDKPLAQDDLSSYQRQSDTVSVATELLTTYDGPDELGLVSLASDKRPSALTEFIVWRKSAN